MAEETKNEGMPLLGQMVGFLVLLFLFMVFLTGSALYQFSGEYEESNQLESENPDVQYLTPEEAGLTYEEFEPTDETFRESFWEKLSLFGPFKDNDFELKDVVLAKSVIDVRNSPAGAIIGEQLKRAKGILKEGPVDESGKTWWRVDFEERPDGWVNQDDITDNVFWFKVLNIFPILFGFLKPFFIFLIILFAILIILVRIKFNKVLERENKKKELQKQQAGIVEDHDIDEIAETGAIYPNNLPTGDDVPKFSNTPVVTEPTIKNEKWEHVKRLMSSSNSSDWRQAIVEADIILDTMLDAMGYEGDSIGDKLKKIEPSDFITLNKAWEAHKVRNKIAHSGSDFVLNKTDAERTIRMYQQVFEEFYFI